MVNLLLILNNISLTINYFQQPINKIMLANGRVGTSRPNDCRGGKGIDATKYGKFWKACKYVLLPNHVAEKRRHSDTVSAYGSHSIPSLVTLATKILQRKVDSKELDHLPTMPLNE